MQSLIIFTTLFHVVLAEKVDPESTVKTGNEHGNLRSLPKSFNSGGNSTGPINSVEPNAHSVLKGGKAGTSNLLTAPSPSPKPEKAGAPPEVFLTEPAEPLTPTSAGAISGAAPEVLLTDTNQSAVSARTGTLTDQNSPTGARFDARDREFNRPARDNPMQNRRYNESAVSARTGTLTDQNSPTGARFDAGDREFGRPADNKMRISGNVDADLDSPGRDMNIHRPPRMYDPLFGNGHADLSSADLGMYRPPGRNHYPFGNNHLDNQRRQRPELIMPQNRLYENDYLYARQAEPKEPTTTFYYGSGPYEAEGTGGTFQVPRTGTDQFGLAARGRHRTGFSSPYVEGDSTKFDTADGTRSSNNKLMESLGNNHPGYAHSMGYNGLENAYAMNLGLADQEPMRKRHFERMGPLRYRDAQYYDDVDLLVGLVKNQCSSPKSLEMIIQCYNLCKALTQQMRPYICDELFMMKYDNYL